MNLKELRAKFAQLTEEAEAAIKAGNADEAERLTAEAEGVQKLIEAAEKTEAMKAQAAKMAEEEEADRKAAEEARIQKLVDERVADALKNVGVKRPGYSEEDPDNEIPLVLRNARGPFDDVDAYQLALGYMVLKAHAPINGQRPSKDYIRAVHGRAQAQVSKHGLPTIGYHDPESTALKSFSRLDAPRLAQPICYHYQADEVVRKALAVKADELMGSDVSGAGDEWIPVFYSRELFRLMRNEAMVASLFRQLEVAGESVVFPIQAGAVTWYKTPQTDDAAELVHSASFITSRISQVSTSNMTLTPAKLSALVIWTGEINEQSLVPMLPFLQGEFVDSGREMLDELLISGDETTGATNISDYGNGSISAYWRLLVLDGLRHHAIVENSGNNSVDVGALTAEDFINIKKLMGTNGKNALNPNKIVWIPDVLLYYKMLSLGEVITQDKFGNAFTIDKGVLQRIWGSPVVPSDQFGATDASGYIHNTTSGNTQGSCLCVRPDQGVIGFGRRMTVETQRIARADAYEIVAHLAVDFDLASLEAVAIGYNGTV
jgi:HK97 family phage major capsid protein